MPKPSDEPIASTDLPNEKHVKKENPSEDSLINPSNESVPPMPDLGGVANSFMDAVVKPFMPKPSNEQIASADLPNEQPVNKENPPEDSMTNPSNESTFSLPMPDFKGVVASVVPAFLTNAPVG